MSQEPTGGHRLSTLTEEEVEKLRKDVKLVPEFKQNKLEREAGVIWDRFYKRNSINFFKDRHWTTREFKELGASPEASSGRRVLLEAGCGVGNAAFPLLAENPDLYVYCCDFSPRAIQYVKENTMYDSSRMLAFQCDLTIPESLASTIAESAVDMVTLFFVLSAIHPGKMAATLRNIQRVLKPGGLVLFRDYGLFDHAMLRFSPGHKLSQNFYVRQDGTRVFYFSKELLNELFSGAGYETVSCQYVERQTVNRKEGLSVCRIFVQGKFRKPAHAQTATASFQQLGEVQQQQPE